MNSIKAPRDALYLVVSSDILIRIYGPSNCGPATPWYSQHFAINTTPHKKLSIYIGWGAILIGICEDKVSRLFR